MIFVFPFVVVLVVFVLVVVSVSSVLSGVVGCLSVLPFKIACLKEG